MCLVEESLTTVEASCSTLKCSCSTGILPVGPVGILPADCSRAAINGQDARLPHRQDACATSEESLDHCGPRKHFTLPFFHNPGDWINRPYPLPHVLRLQHHWMPCHARQHHPSSASGVKGRLFWSPL